MRLLVALTLTAAGAFAGQDDVQICYFSLNSDKEFATMQNLVAAINAKTKHNIFIHEFQMEGSDPKTSFENMIKSGQRCDALVVSGHHTGSFGGKRAGGSLSIDTFEKLACRPEYRQWFDDVKALWLQGCRTLGVGAQEHIEDNPEYDANAQTDRVRALVDQDHLTLDARDLNYDFTTTLDQDNPLSSRYLRAFPRASVFGWTKTAPGGVTASELSVPFHLANIIKLSQGQDVTKDLSVIKAENFNKLSPAQAERYEQALQVVTQKKCTDETLCKAAWLAHGHDDMQNDDLMAYESLAKSPNPLLENAQRNQCMMISDDFDTAFAGFKAAVSSDSLAKLNFNSVVAFFDHYSGSDRAQVIQKELEHNTAFKTLLLHRITDPRVGILAKIDAYVLLRDHFGGKNEAIEQRLLQICASNKLLGNPSVDDSASDIRAMVLSSLIKSDLLSLDEKGLATLKSIPGVRPANLLPFMIRQISYSSYDEKMSSFITRFIVTTLTQLKDNPSPSDQAIAFQTRSRLSLTYGPTHIRDFLALTHSADPAVAKIAVEALFDTKFRNWPDESRKILHESLLHDAATCDNSLRCATAIFVLAQFGESEAKLNELLAKAKAKLPADFVAALRSPDMGISSNYHIPPEVAATLRDPKASPDRIRKAIWYFGDTGFPVALAHPEYLKQLENAATRIGNADAVQDFTADINSLKLNLYPRQYTDFPLQPSSFVSGLVQMKEAQVPPDVLREQFKSNFLKIPSNSSYQFDFSDLTKLFAGDPKWKDTLAEIDKLEPPDAASRPLLSYYRQIVELDEKLAASAP